MNILMKKVLYAFVMQITRKEINMKKIVIFAMIFLFAGCAWDESGRRDNNRHEGNRHETGTQHQGQVNDHRGN